ncbi:hypothetical protein FHR99_000945 [Litorivivens lipolytica]|uniref:Uncharacterized protein n=1 Tax=Litorivivens lipolytica TaxID=1524264 RepID=A0A7W4W4H2_9GAMM|nr:hypothetical protein [Litorivivens lipolytica]MBB3046709.1 hypothetical protein [Litorivivens lipolytica]
MLQAIQSFLFCAFFELLGARYLISWNGNIPAPAKQRQLLQKTGFGSKLLRVFYTIVILGGSAASTMIFLTAANTCGFPDRVAMGRLAGVQCGRSTVYIRDWHQFSGFSATAKKWARPAPPFPRIAPCAAEIKSVRLQRSSNAVFSRTFTASPIDGMNIGYCFSGAGAAR